MVASAVRFLEEVPLCTWFAEAKTVQKLPAQTSWRPPQAGQSPCERALSCGSLLCGLCIETRAATGDSASRVHVLLADCSLEAGDTRGGFAWTKRFQTFDETH